MLNKWKVMVIMDTEGMLDLKYILYNPNYHELIDCVLLALDLDEYGQDGNYRLRFPDQKNGV